MPRPDNPPPEHPWHQQPDETPEAYEAFTAYRDLGRANRSTRRAAQTINKNTTMVGKWSGRHDWVRRVTAYDRYLDDRRRAEREDAILTMERQQATQLAASRQALSAPIQSLLERIASERSEGRDPFAGLKMDALTRLATNAIRHLGSVVEAERLVHGLSTQNVAPDAPGSVDEARRRAEQMTRPELEEYLLGVDDGRAAALRELGIEMDGGGGS